MSLLKKIGIWFLALVIIMISLAYTLFFLNQDMIKNEIVLGINRKIAGKLLIEEVGLSLFSGFPKATISVESVKLFEHKTDSIIGEQIPLLELEEVSVSFNVIDLINNKLMIEEVVLDGGSIALMNNADGTLNILNAINESATDTTESQNNVSLHLNSIEILNLRVQYHDMPSEQYLSTTINSLETAIAIAGDSLKGEISLDYRLDSLVENGLLIMAGHSLILAAEFEGEMNNLAFAITNGKVKFDLLEVDLEGYYNNADSGYVDINISANHNDISELAKLEMFNPEYLPDIRSGKLTLSTTIQGKTQGQLPVINAEVRLSGLHVHNKFGDVIEDSGFHIKFYSGVEKDMNDGLLYIDSIDFGFASGGYLTGDLEIVNFAEPTYKINWQLANNLVDLSNVFLIPGIKNMQGMVRSQVQLEGKFDLQNKQFDNPQGTLSVQFENCQLSLSDTDYLLKGVNGRLSMNEGTLRIDDLTFDANGNQLELNTSIENLLPYLLGIPTALTTEISLHTHSLNTFKFLAFDPKLQEQINYKVDSLELDIRANFLSTDMDSFMLIPTGNLSINTLTAKVSGLPLINKVKGSIIVLPDALRVKGLTGYVGESPFIFNLSMLNYDGYFHTDTLETMTLAVNFESEKLVPKDFFTINGKFLLPESYEDEVLKNVSFNANLTTTNFELQKSELIPEFEFQIGGLNFQTHFSPVKFRDISIFGLIKDNNIYINGMFGQLGRSDVFMNAEFSNALATTDTISRPFKSRISINSKLLDLDELIRLGEAGSGHHLEENETESSDNPFAGDYPITDLNINIGELSYYGAIIKNLSGILNMEDHNIIKLNQVRLQSGEYGSFEFTGVFDASNHKEAILTSNIKISEVDLSKLDVAYIQDGKEVKIGDHLKGVFNGEIEASVPLHQDFSFDLARVSGSLKAVIKNGALVNYAPFQALVKYFKNKDLSNIYFADLINTMVFDQGKIHLPFMTISTTLGTIFISGYQTIDAEMEFNVQVPAKLVAGAVFNSFFAANKGDDGKKDEISTGAKGKYITVHIYGDADGYNFKLGKKHGKGAAADVTH